MGAKLRVQARASEIRGFAKHAERGRMATLSPMPQLDSYLSRRLLGRSFLAALIPLFVCTPSIHADSALRIKSLARSGLLAWTNAPVPGVCTVEWADTPAGPWSQAQNIFATNSAGLTTLPIVAGNRFHRLSAVSVAATAPGFTNLVQAYGRLETIAGTGWARTDNVSFWDPAFEGGPATEASLSRPHFAMADRAGQIYIADKNSHAILRRAPDGTIHTHAGTHTGGFNGEGPAPATNLQLAIPNGLWVRADGTVYVLDTGNSRVRRVSTNGSMATLFAAPNGERGLWVKDDESLAYFGATTKLKKWTPAANVETLASGFGELGLFVVEPNGSLVVCDRGEHYVYRVSAAGLKTILAGNGTTSGGGDGASGLATGLDGVRGVWPVPTGGYLLLTHDGCQLWYLDAAGIIHLLLNGGGGRTHDGDGAYFYEPEMLKISEGRSVTMDYAGNILLVESDYGYVRRIRFGAALGSR